MTTEVIFVALAITYVSIQIVRGRLPLAIMARIRGIIGTPNDDSGIPTPRNELAHLINCIYCVSFWVALGACWLMDYPLWWSLGFAMFASFVEEKI